MTAVDRRTARAKPRVPAPRVPTLVVPPAGRPCAGLRRGDRAPRRHPARTVLIGPAVIALVAISVVNPVAAVAAVGTGFFNIAGGGGAVISFLALTAAGVPVLTAHATGQFVTPSSFLTMLGRARQHQPGRFLLVTGSLGTVLGVVLLKLTPPATVQVAAPYVLLAAGLLVVFQGPVQRRIQRIGWQLGPKTTLGLMFVVGVYAGMIGVGTGTLALVVLGLTARYADTPLQQLILTRNVLLLGMAGVVAIVFIPTGLVNWSLAAVLALPGAVGGWVAIRLLHRLPVRLLRGFIAATAGAAAVWMWLR